MRRDLQLSLCKCFLVTLYLRLRWINYLFTPCPHFGHALTCRYFNRRVCVSIQFDFSIKGLMTSQNPFLYYLMNCKCVHSGQVMFENIQKKCRSNLTDIQGYSKEGTFAILIMFIELFSSVLTTSSSVILTIYTMIHRLMETVSKK